MANTGYLINPRLKKVTDDGNEYPLDVNNVRTSISGLPQATMPLPEDDPRYRAEDAFCYPNLPRNYMSIGSVTFDFPTENTFRAVANGIFLNIPFTEEQEVTLYFNQVRLIKPGSGFDSLANLSTVYNIPAGVTALGSYTLYNGPKIYEGVNSVGNYARVTPLIVGGYIMRP